MRTLSIRRRTVGIVAVAILALRATPSLAQDSPLDPVNQLNNGLLQIMKAGRSTPFEQRFQMLAPIIDRAFDLDAVLQASVGLGWSSMTPDQQKGLKDAFRRYTIASYVSAFDEFNGQQLLVNPEPRSVGNEQVVRTQIIPRSGDGHKLDYVLRKGPNGWRIVDVLADGAVSRVAVQRSDFRSLLRSGGPAALQKSLESKAAALSG
jgi:phospholipid transport system substrate-binding protein